MRAQPSPPRSEVSRPAELSSVDVLGVRPYDAFAMHESREQGQANLTAILILVGLIVAGVWIWKRLPLDVQDVLIEQAVPILFVVVVLAGFGWTVVRKIREGRERRRVRTKLIAAFERAASPMKRRDLAFQLVEVNRYRRAGLESVAPALQDVFITALQRELGDKQHRIRGMAASYLGVVGDQASVALLLKALEDDHAYVRSCAALGLARLRAKEASDVLKKLSEEDWDQTVRSRAREALERIR